MHVDDSAEWIDLLSGVASIGTRGSNGVICNCLMGALPYTHYVCSTIIPPCEDFTLLTTAQGRGERGASWERPQNLQVKPAARLVYYWKRRNGALMPSCWRRPCLI